jgi:hypothetical protein
MRSLAILMLLTTPALAENPCEALARAVCPADDQLGQCMSFVDSEMRGPDGKAMSGVNRLMGCKLVLDDEATLGDYRARMRARAETRWYAMQVTVEPRKSDGAPWDALGGAPDIAACFTIDGVGVGCEPGGPKATIPGDPKCRDAMGCEFKVQARRGAVVAVKVVDVDGLNNDLIGHCEFIAGEGTAECRGQLSLMPESAGGGAGAGVVDARILGRWDVDIERTMAHEPGFSALSVEERQEAVGRRLDQMHKEYVAFEKGGRLVYTRGEEVVEARYAITALKGKVLTLAVEGEGETEMWQVTVADEGLVVRRAAGVLHLERAP